VLDEARVQDLDQVLDPGGSSSSSRHRVLDQERDEAGPVGLDEEPVLDEARVQDRDRVPDHTGDKCSSSRHNRVGCSPCSCRPCSCRPCFH
jgi:hypothetical protein